MVDMSKAFGTSMDIFKGLMDHGPLTLYSANTKTKIPTGTLHRHFKQMEKEGKIRAYQSRKKGRKKIEYGPTIYGILSFYRKDKRIADKIENYFLLWADHTEFQRELEKEGFDISLDKKIAKNVFRKYMDYFSAVEEQIDMIRKGEDVVPREMLVVISSGILSQNTHYQKMWVELYRNLPGMRKSLDNYMKNMIKSYNDIKKSIPKGRQ